MEEIKSEKCFLCGRTAEDGNEQEEFTSTRRGELICHDCLAHYEEVEGEGEGEGEGPRQGVRADFIEEMREMDQG